MEGIESLLAGGLIGALFVIAIIKTVTQKKYERRDRRVRTNDFDLPRQP